MNKLPLLLLLFLLPLCGRSQTPAADTTAAPAAPKKVVLPERGHQVRIGFDLFQPVYNAVAFRRTALEFYGDYYYKRELYLVGEAGFGGGKYEFDNLNYTTVNSFVRLGVDKSMLQTQSGRDWDMVFLGARYGLGIIRRGAARYALGDTLFGKVTDETPAQTMLAHWLEVMAGIRVEVAPRVYAGWNFRAKFLLNEQGLTPLPPYFIAGYGKGDRNLVFGFNFYLCYALRYGKNTVPAPPKPEE